MQHNIYNVQERIQLTEQQRHEQQKRRELPADGRRQHPPRAALLKRIYGRGRAPPRRRLVRCTTATTATALLQRTLAFAHRQLDALGDVYLALVIALISRTPGLFIRRTQLVRSTWMGFSDF